MIEEKGEAASQALKEIVEAIHKIKYGEVVITIHDSKIVQIEERKKFRFI